MERVAIYYTPSTHSLLSQEGEKWLGRNNTSSTFMQQKTVPGLSISRLREITANPFHYGFHGTIKPPFSLRDGINVNCLKERLAEFAAAHYSFILPPLHVTYMHDFFCLKPTQTCRPLNNLARAAVQYFDDLRQPAAKEEIARRRASASLSDRQEELLLAWGYPFVMDEFRFHMSLTGKIENAEERVVVEKELRQRFTPHLMNAVAFDQLCLFSEINMEPLKMIAVYPLASAKKEV